MREARYFIGGRGMMIILILTGLLICMAVSSTAEAKSKTNLYSLEEVQKARENVKKELWARQEYDRIIAAANKWASYSDEFLRDLITPASIPRAFDVNFRQCPIHSEEIKKYGSYPWIIDLEHPWKVKCPVGGEYYPTNDFDPRNPGKPEDVVSDKYVDTGWGWKKPDEEEKYWFVAYYNHWTWLNFIIPATEVLGKAYLLTGDQKYSHKAAIMLDRIAEEYPHMDYVRQSRYGTEIQKGTYHGRIVNHIWETGVVTTLARAYDYIYEGLEGDKELEKFRGKSVAQIKENIETNLLESAAQSIYTMDGRIVGNYGMHQRALATIAVVLDNENSDKYVDWVLFNDGRGKGYTYQGMASGLINLLYRDGVGFESSPGYNFGWIGNFTAVAEVLIKRGINLYEDYPRMKAMFDVPIDLVMNGNFTPNIGDSGSVLSTGRVGWSGEVYDIAFRRYGDPHYAQVLYQLNFYGNDLFKESMKDKVVETVKTHGSEVANKGSDNLPGYGLALLRGGGPDNPIGVSLYYGKGGGHDHDARLNIEVFGKGMRLVPDLGYPEFMSGYHKKLCGWTGHTVSHVTVMVNERKQDSREGGRLHHFVSLPMAQYVDVSAEGSYKVTDMYRRSLALINAPDGDNAYIVDIFRVKGGVKHDYSIHGPAGVFSVEGISLSAVQKRGTLAGEDIPFGTLYDDPVMKDPAYRGSYGSYRGSGFGYLYNLQRGNPGSAPWSANWDVKDGKKTGLKMTFLGDDGHEVVVAEGEPPQKGNVPKSLKYILRRRESEDGSSKLDSTYITLIQPYTERPFIERVESLKAYDGEMAGGVVGLKVDYGEKVDYIIQSLDPAGVCSFDGGITSQASLAILTTDKNGGVCGVSLVNGGLLEMGGFRLEVEKGYSGAVETIDYERRTVVVKLDPESPPLPINGALQGRSLIFANEYRSTEYEIGEVVSVGDGRYELELRGSDFLSGYGRYLQGRGFGKFQLVTADRDLFKREYYKGMYLMNKDRSAGGLIIRAESDGMSFLVQPDEPMNLKEGDEFYIYDFGIGSRFTIDTALSVKKEVKEGKGGFLGLFGSKEEVATGNWHLETTSSIRLRLPLEDGQVGLEYMDSRGEWVEVNRISEGDGYIFKIDVSDLPSGKGLFRVRGMAK